MDNKRFNTIEHETSPVSMVREVREALPSEGLGLHFSRQKWHSQISQEGLINPDSAVFVIHPIDMEQMDCSEFAQKTILTLAIGFYHAFSLASIQEIRNLKSDEEIVEWFRRNNDRLPQVYSISSQSVDSFKQIIADGQTYETLKETIKSFPYGKVMNYNSIPAEQINLLSALTERDIAEALSHEDIGPTAHICQHGLPRFFKKSGMTNLEDFTEIEPGDITIHKLCFALAVNSTLHRLKSLVCNSKSKPVHTMKNEEYRVILKALLDN